MKSRPDSAGLLTSTEDERSLEAFEQALASLFRTDGRALATIERALAHERTLGLHRRRRSGLTADEEPELLSARG